MVSTGDFLVNRFEELFGRHFTADFNDVHFELRRNVQLPQCFGSNGGIGTNLNPIQVLGQPILFGQLEASARPVYLHPFFIAGKKRRRNNIARIPVAKQTKPIGRNAKTTAAYILR